MEWYGEDPSLTAGDAEEVEWELFELFMPGWEDRLAENDFYNAYDVMDELREIGML